MPKSSSTGVCPRKLRVEYPLKLVTTRGRLFVRWDGNGERLNVEATSKGLNCHPDDYYRQYPLGFESSIMIRPCKKAPTKKCFKLDCWEEVACVVVVVAVIVLSDGTLEPVLGCALP
jgi:hypothetical protein